MTCSRTIVSVIVAPQGYAYVGCCDEYIPLAPTQVISWIPIDEDAKAALLEPWDGESFVGPADVSRTSISNPGGGGWTATPGGEFGSPPQVLPDGGGVFVE